MPVKNNREYRNLGAFEPSENYITEGYASTFEPYLLFKDGDMEFYEEIDPRAFDNTDMSDVIFLRDHSGSVLARTKNGSIELSVDSHGLKTRTDLSLTERSREMYEDIAVKNYTQMSFSFVVGEEHFEEAGNTVTRVIDSVRKIYDISAVAFPQNPGTDIGVSYRSLFNGVIEAREAERLRAIKERTLLKIKLNKR
jgi:HK97 family phage prohead protease